MNPVSPFLAYRGDELFAEGCSITELAQRYGTPLYIYSKAALEAAYGAYAEALRGRDSLVCFGMKANSNLAVLNLFARLGAGFDIVSGGELARVLAAGGDPKKVVFSGVGKTAAEMRAALNAEVFCFNVESISELRRLNQVAGELGKVAPVSLRVNPDVDAKTHPYISTGLKENKFGIAYDEALRAYHEAAKLPHLAINGIDCHIGSQLTDISPYGDALEKVLDLVEALETVGISLDHIDLGGGLGIRYQDESPPSVKALMDLVFARIEKRGHAGKKVVFEPGRSLVGNAGALVTTVEYLKPGPTKSFAIVDAAMNDLHRPTLYDAWHNVLRASLKFQEPLLLYDIVGPICESGDWLARERQLAIQEGDLLVVESAGAYAMTMASNYNTRPRAAEVMVDGSEAHEIRARESVDALFAAERLLPS